jgi:hypothetical protein
VVRPYTTCSYSISSNRGASRYLSTQHPIDLGVLQAAIGYSAACQREQHAEGDPWEWVFAATEACRDERWMPMNNKDDIRSA